MSDVVFKRKFRWVLEADLPGGKLEPRFVKVAARPNLNIEEVEINYLGNTAWIPGKSEWQVIHATIWEIEKDDKFWSVITSVFPMDPPLKVGEYPPPEKLGTFKLTLYDGCGNAMEEWELKEAFVEAINFGELDHSSTEELNVELTIKYKPVNYKANTSEAPLPSHPKMGSMGLGSLGTKRKCPNCNHEWNDCTNIIF